MGVKRLTDDPALGARRPQEVLHIVLQGLHLHNGRCKHRRVMPMAVDEVQARRLGRYGMTTCGLAVAAP